MNDGQRTILIKQPDTCAHQDSRNMKETGAVTRDDPIRMNTEESQTASPTVTSQMVMVPRQHTSRKIHILGAGNVGKFVAHALAGIVDRPPITLLLHRPLAIQQWYDEGQSIDIVRQNASQVRTGFDVEYTGMVKYPIHGQSMTKFDRIFGYARDQTQWHIEKLVVATKAPFTVYALMSIRDRLGPTSTICFLQNGMGIIDDVNDKVFPNPATRPRYVIGTISHGLAAHHRQFTAVHNGSGEIFLSLVPADYGSRHNNIPDNQLEASSVSRMSYGWTASSRSLLKTFARTPELAAVGVQYSYLLQRQLEKLAVNSVINPLSVVFDCTNGQLLHNFAVTRLMRELLTEVSKIVINLPELRGIQDLDEKFSIDRLESLSVQIAMKTANNTSSMLQDSRNGRRTEIDYINGYIVSRGEELGIGCPVNLAIVQMVKAKSVMKWREHEQYIPFA